MHVDVSAVQIAEPIIADTRPLREHIIRDFLRIYFNKRKKLLVLYSGKTNRRNYNAGMESRSGNVRVCTMINIAFAYLHYHL